MSNTVKKLEDSKLWREVFEVAERVHRLIQNLPDEEQWGLRFRLKNDCLDVSSSVSEAVGSIDPRDIKWLLGKTRGRLFSIKNSLKLAHKTDILPIDPEIMVAIDKAVLEIDKQLDNLPAAIKKWFDEFDATTRKKQ